MKNIKDVENLKGVKVLLRLDMNVPVENGAIVDDFRIRMAEPTLKFLKEKGARTIIMSHIGDDGKATLRPVADYLMKKFPVTFVLNYATASKEANELKEGEFILLENLRQNAGEKANDEKFAQELASFGDIYVNEAFSVSHREHASVCGVTKFLPSYAGILFANEVENLSKSFNPKRPFIFILGGAKFDTKLPLIEKFMGIADSVFVGGALANNFFKEKGLQVGKSVVSPENFDLKRFFENPKLLLPIDIMNQNKEVKDLGAVTAEDMMLDVGPKTVALLKEKINQSALVLWNGPLGHYENGFKGPTLELAKMISESKAESVVGGGDTLAAIAELGIGNKFTFISTSGGAMLDYLANGTLPGIEALEHSKNIETK